MTIKLKGMKILNNSLQEIAEKLIADDNFIILGHVEPDGDCIGSLFSLKWLLEKIGKKSRVMLEQATLDTYSYLEIKKDEYLSFPDDESVIDGFHSATYIALDSGSLERLGKGKDLIKDHFLINIDHHEDNPTYGDLNYVNSQKAAVGEIIYDLAEIMELNIDVKIGRAIATAIIADTGSLKYENTSARVLRILAKLVDDGVDIYQINKEVFGKYSYSSLVLKGLALSTLSLNSDNNVAWLYVDQEMMADAGTDMTDGLVNYARDIDQIEVGISFISEDRLETKVSFRSNYYVKVNEIAAKFGGGGHPRAAGCTIKKPLEAAITDVLEEVEKFV